MIRKDSGRFLAILFALTVMLLSWLAFEYSLSPPSGTKETAEVRSLDRHPGTPQQASSGALVERPLPPEPPADAPPAGRGPTLGNADRPPPPEGLFRCKRGGKTIYTDRRDQCDDGATVARVEATPASAGFTPYRPYQDQLADLEAEQRRNAPAAAPQDDARQRANRDANAALCRELDERIRWLDSALRQPHSAALGDHWTVERRQATNRRYEARC